MVAETTIAFVFAVFGLVSTVVLIALGVVGLAKVDDLRRGIADAGTSDRAAESAPLETLRERYARGEVTDEEFERKADRLLRTDERPRGETDPAFEVE